ncbi:hypothetical protein GCM10009665_46220 [Kitasatospora nipponensis]|uniref:Uncharacterized protein n=1 Tax=Kitasatospora nipponensis TaxID=258049 RepID=A0ABN1WHZ4_9ACTN
MHAKLLPEIGGSSRGGASTGEYRGDYWVGGLTSDRSLPGPPCPGDRPNPAPTAVRNCKTAHVPARGLAARPKGDPTHPGNDRGRFEDTR